ncbi:putative ubiquitin-like-specific protease 1B isoform X2 [Brachypodium distachyon]|uniref:putative ubiquitin-like-specific protease 1B isoform X2 n=1 Tax=Brachypodium distachyon TaxID=15368 RepID=UPI0005300855|nr:putative ubiquitin-like-specific protease 1B isoform X2 [Brachypodium distachyon]|eukprot:XP_010228634.1 putative ubiquitin-like-specific protease 1B isoform X2 [Brachypodium distachyon]
MISDAGLLFNRRKRRLPASDLLYPHFRSPKRKHFFFESPPIPPEARSLAFDMGNFLSSSLPDCMRRDSGLEVFRGWVRASQDARGLTVATSDDVELGQVVIRRFDPTKVARQAVPPPREKMKPFYKEALEKTGLHDKRLGEIEVEVTLQKEVLEELRKAPKEDLSQLFIPLTAEEENEVHDCLYGYGSSEVLVLHESSNIEVSREKFRCLRPHGWLNDEVINLYLELLKERGIREPKRFLKCHFFNTFFYKKLAGGKNGYDYKSVKRWTTCRKLGYELIDCDKIFVPVHQSVHWCLAIINMKEKTFQYLDSLCGKDSRVRRVLDKYIADEVKDKSNKEIDISSWKEASLDYVPLQQNGWDCGMFMLKYIDFYSRGLSLSFGQEHMEYFRMRTVKEILRLRAD